MAKALKIAAIVATVAAVTIVTGGAALGLGLSLGTAAFGVSAGTLIAASTLLSAGASLLSAKPKAPDTSAANAQRLQVQIDVRAPRKIIVGTTAMATDLRDQESSSDGTYLHRFLVVASHRVNAIREIWFDDKLAWTAAGGAQGDYAPWLQVIPVLEGSAANAINIGPRMGSSRRYTGLAYVYLRYTILAHSKKLDSPFASSIPSRVTIIGDGASFYDPRLDSTVPGGSGPMRVDDQSTWGWNESACRNPVLAMLFYLLGWRINGKLAVGKGIPANRIDLASFITAANLCDEPVTIAGGGTEPRYRCDGIFSEADDPQNVLDNLKAACNAILDDMDGRIRVTVLHNDLATPIGELTTADVIGAFTWNQTPALSDCINVIRGGYTDPSTTSLYQLVDGPEVRIASVDGIDRTQTVNLPVVESPSQWERLVKQRVQRMQFGGTFTAVFQATAWKFQKGDLVRFSFFPLGWSRKPFRIAEMTVQVDGTVPLLLREEDPAIYAHDDNNGVAIVGAPPASYDPANWPILLGITEAGTTAAWEGVTGDGKPADNATNSADPESPFGPDATVRDYTHKVGQLYGAVEILADTPDPDKLLDGAQALVDGIENQGIAQLAEQLLNQGRQKRNEAAQHLDGLPMGVYVKRVERTSEEADAKLAETISIVKASGEAGDGLIAGLLDAQIFRMDQARYDDLGAEATAISNVRADAQFLVDGVERRNTGEIDRLEKANADASHAEAIVVAGVRAETQLLVDGVQQRTLGEIERVERTSSDALQASASAVDAITARFENASATNAGDIRQLGAVVATEKDVTATTFAEIEADFDGRVKAQGARTDQVFASEAEARAQSLDKLRADVAVTIGDEAARYAAETQRLESNIVTKDGAQSVALQSTRAELVMESEGARALMEAVAKRSEQASVNEQGARAASVEQVRAEVAGVAGEVLVQKEALVDLQGRVRAYLVLSVEAGTGRAIVRLEADDVEGSLIDFAANRLRFANPVDGKMITAMQIIGGNVEIVNDLYLGTGCIINRGATHMLVQGVGFGSAGQFLEWFGPIKGDLSECTEAQAIRYTKTDGTAYSAGIVAEGQLRNQKTNFDFGLTSVAIGPFVTNGKTRKFVVSMSYNASGTRWSAYRDEGAVTASFVLERLRSDGGWDHLGNGELGSYVYDDGGNGGIAYESEPANYRKSASGTIEITDTSGGTDPIQLRARVTALNAPGVTGTAYRADVISQVLQIVSYEP